jgi:hypothetical protein
MSHPSRKFRDFLFMDLISLTRYAEEFREEIQEKVMEADPGLGQQPDQELSAREKIILVESFLENLDEIAVKRPIRLNIEADSQNQLFVLESMMARKVIMPLDENRQLGGLSELAVWISDPDPSLYSTEPYDWTGTFLYLTECHWDFNGYSTVFSGVSALQGLINQITGKDFLAYVNEEFEPYGRGRDLHPVDKLKDIGGIATEERRIKSLYRKRYFTDEQVYSYKGECRRVNDLLGYPLYIEADD